MAPSKTKSTRYKYNFKGGHSTPRLPVLRLFMVAEMNYIGIGPESVACVVVSVFMECIGWNKIERCERRIRALEWSCKLAVIFCCFAGL